MKWMPGPAVRFDELVDHLSQQLLHRHSDARLLKACSKAVDVQPKDLHHRGPRAHRVEVRPPPRHHPRLPRPLQPVTTMTTPIPRPPRSPAARSTPRCSAPPTAPRRRQPTRRPRRRPRPGRRLDHGRRRGRDGLSRRWRPAPARSSSWSRCAAGPTGSTWSSRTPTPTTTGPGPTSAIPVRPAARQGRDVRPAPGDGLPGPAVDGRADRHRARGRAARRQPVALRRHGGGRGRRPRLPGPRRLAQPADRHDARRRAAPGLQRRLQHDPDLPLRAAARDVRGPGRGRRPAGRRRRGLARGLRARAVVGQPDHAGQEHVGDAHRDRHRSAPSSPPTTTASSTPATTSAGPCPPPPGSSAATSASR